MEVNSVHDVFKHQIVFMTGVTGAVGTVLIEKLLRCCPEINKIYVLIRSQGNFTVHDRLQKLFQLPLYCKVSADLFEKVVPIEGDILLPELGINDDIKNDLKNNVGIVFHCAANVSFNTDLKTAINSNLLGTKKVLNLCKTMSKLQSFVYVSTAYSNYPHNEVAERLYPIQFDPNNIIELVNKSTKDELKEIQKQIFRNHPNNYTFSKQLTEHLLVKEHDFIPLAIIRPSIGTWKEPFPGWLPVNNGASGFIAGAYKGVFRTTQASPEKIADFIPSDVVVNALICAVWNLTKQGSSKVQIYHVTSGNRNPITWKEYTNFIIESSRKFPCREVAWYPGAKCRESKVRNKIAVRLYQLWPSYIVDFFEQNTSVSHNRHKKESLVKIQQRFVRGMDLTQHFATKQWNFYNENIKEISSVNDNKEFYTDISELNWANYFDCCIKEIRQHYFKDPLSSLKDAREFMKRWKRIHIMSTIALLLIIYTFLSQFTQGYMLINLMIFFTAFLFWL